MKARVRLLVGLLSVLLVGGLGSVGLVAPASATVSTLCSGYSACSKAGMSASGYAANNQTMWWRMFAGHNCTNYAAYRMVKSGLPNVRPWSGGGNATYWGTSMAGITDAKPMVGSIAWWKAGVYPAGSAGHVAYVERVVSADEIIVSQDSWGGDFSWARVTRTTKGWPSGFIHFNDAPMRNLTKPAVTGIAKVGSTLTVSAGTWSPSDATVRYQWRADGVRLVGATASKLVLTPELEDKVLSVRVSASKLGYPTTSVVTRPTPTVQPGVITSLRAPTISGEARVDSTLTADTGAWKPSPDRLSLQWWAGDSPIAGATSTSLRVGPTLVGKPLRLTVTARKAGYTDVTASSASTEAVAPGTLALTGEPSLTGVPRPGETLTLHGPAVLPAADAAIQWLRGGRPVPGATGTTYPLTNADLGARIAVKVTLTRPGYTTVVTRTPTTTRVKSVPRIRATAVSPAPGRLVVTAQVTARGVTPVDGTLLLRSSGRVLAQARLRDGVATLRVPGLAPGTRTYRIAYAGSPRVSWGYVERRFTVR